MKIFLIEIYNEKTIWKISRVKRKLGINFADMFRAGVTMYLEKLEKDNAVSFPDDEFEAASKKGC